LPRLLNIRTDLSTYNNAQYGYDRRGSGPRNTNASGQPYELTDIPSRSFNESDFGGGTNKPFQDFILRGGQLLPGTIATDVSRLTKMFTDLKSPNGLLFTAKQAVLSRTGVNIKAVAGGVKDSRNNRIPLNDGIYLPTSTLLQAAVNPIGGHLLKQGINPFFDTSEAAARGTVGGIFNFLTGNSLPLSNPIYFETNAFKERINTGEVSSRLAQFLENNQNRTDTSDILYSYSGGPNSVVGIGKTTIKALSDQRTGINNDFLNTSGFFNTGKTPSTNFGFDYNIFKGGTTNSNFETFRGGTYFGDLSTTGSKSVTGRYSTQTNTPLVNLLNNQFKITNDNISGGYISSVGQSVFQNGTFNSQAPTVVSGLGSSLDYNQLMTAKGTGSVAVGDENNSYPQAQILQDFRRSTKNKKSATGPNYIITSNQYEERVNLGQAGAKNITTSYVSGNNGALDKINALPLYKSSNVDPSKPINDLCKFRIGVISNKNPLLKTYIHFRAFLDGMDDSYSADWKSQKFSGRGESLYNYQGFDRKFNLGWTVTAQSKQELMPMYQKLNYLASVCAPDYSPDGYMRGNLIELTVGGYLFNQVGIMTGINYTVPMESPWEIGINETSNTGRLKSDSSVKELPFMIKVSGFSFIPIHDFVPSIQKNKFNEKGELISFGKEKYISLSNGYYGDGYKNETQRVESEQANTFVGTEQGQQTIDAIANINFRP
jgi:hypothetical protein|tara:strand:- start:3453 stop:5594 length:2142 start_codon:yes stop_codon:yes gene_type:complete